MNRRLMSEEHELFRKAFRQFIEREVVPHQERWRERGHGRPRGVAQGGRRAGFLCPWLERGARRRRAATSCTRWSSWRSWRSVYESGFAMPLHSDIVVPYIHAFGSDAQKQSWLPGCASGRADHRHRHDRAGHRLGPRGDRAPPRVRDGDDYVINGAKTFISQRHPVRPVHRRGQDRHGSGRPAPRHLAVRGRGRSPGLHQGQEARARWAWRRRTPSELAFEDCRVPGGQPPRRRGRRAS